jgi:uncharacterized protein
VHDPREGLAPDGTIRTGADRSRIPERFAPVLAEARRRIVSAAPSASVLVYGSVATGVAQAPESDVDLLTIGLADDDARAISASLSTASVALCRSVEIAAASPSDFVGDSDAAYGGRVFLHHYCVHLAGPSHDTATRPFHGDRRAARGFNGDIAVHRNRWMTDLAAADPALLSRRVARKTLLAVAGLVSIHDATWTTDRERAARRWGEIESRLATGLGELWAWCGGKTPTAAALEHQLQTTVDVIVRQFHDRIGLWTA